MAEKRMLQSAPNLDYLKAAWSALASISGRNASQSYEACGLSLQRINHSTIVHKGAVQVATMPLRYTRGELRVGFLGRIENEVRKAVAELETVLIHTLDLPERHQFVVELEESMRALRRAGSRLLSMYVVPESDADPATAMAAEMRIFLDAPRACLFVYRLGTERTDLLADAPKRTRMPRAGSYGELAKRMADTVNAAIRGEFTAPAA